MKTLKLVVFAAAAAGLALPLAAPRASSAVASTPPPGALNAIEHPSAGDSSGPVGEAIAWHVLAPQITALLNRPAGYSDLGDDNSLATPQMNGEGGIEHIAGRAGSTLYISTENGEASELFDWLRTHGGGQPVEYHGATQVVSAKALQFARIGRSGEAQLRQHGWPVDSSGSAIAFAIESTYAMMPNARPLTSADEHVIHGLVVLMVASAERGGKFSSADEREAAYQKILVEAEERREAFAANTGSAADAVRDDAIGQLRSLLKLDITQPPDQLICSYVSDRPCSKLALEARPYLDRLADKFRY